MISKPRRSTWKSRLRKAKAWTSLLILGFLIGYVMPRAWTWALNRRSFEPAPSSITATESQFDLALQTVLQFSSDSSGLPKILGTVSQFGITQLDYDFWRQMEGKPPKDVRQIEPQEVAAIYQLYWNSGNCQQYAPPLDVVCLDTVVSFGIEEGVPLLAQLPLEPQQAAQEVLNRRQTYRQHLVRLRRLPRDRMLLQQGAQRDRALQQYLQNFTPPATPVPDRPPEPASGSPLSAQDIYNKVKPATVEIRVAVQYGIIAPASGLILNANGLILTNYHVIEPNPTAPMSVHLADGRQFTGRVIRSDPTLDLALIQLSGANGLPVASFADSSGQVAVGDTVYAIGSPHGESWKMTTAQVIELNSTCANGNSPLRCIRTPSGFLLPGNSGGPLIDASGRIIGINRAIQQATGEGVSIPIETVQQFIQQSGQSARR